ncbi:unnamed protein product [Brassica napus]|uniref:(rape) hypothetical protein n=1 Tax=Brassica napus TaxID=3708 RepID=A0A816N5Y0_BRANA|nr:unnamed protein product [Brassica napus]
MSLAIKVIILFILVESSWGKYAVNPFAANPFADEEKQINQEIDYFDILRGTIRAWQREAEQKYPLWTSANYMERASYLQEKVRGYVQLWGKWKNHTGYPFGDLRNKLQGDLWPVEYGVQCHQYEGQIILTYLIYGLSAETD